MLSGIDPILRGTLLAHLDATGHSDAVVVADAHFPAARLGARVVDTPDSAHHRFSRRFAVCFLSMMRRP